MIRGHPPYVAICEAALKAEGRGMIVLVLEAGQDLPVHLVLCDGPCVSFVRVRRMKYPRFSVKDIEAVCRNDIALLRTISVTDEIFRELWVRGPDRKWHRYLVLSDAIEELDGFDDDRDEKPAEGKVPPSPPVFHGAAAEYRNVCPGSGSVIPPLLKTKKIPSRAGPLFLTGTSCLVVRVEREGTEGMVPRSCLIF